MWIVLLHDLVHIEDYAVLLREDTSGANAGTGGALLALTIKVASGLSPTALLARDASNEPRLDLCHGALERRVRGRRVEFVCVVMNVEWPRNGKAAEWSCGSGKRSAEREGEGRVCGRTERAGRERDYNKSTEGRGRRSVKEEKREGGSKGRRERSGPGTRTKREKEVMVLRDSFLVFYLLASIGAWQQGLSARQSRPLPAPLTHKYS
jgi:hypothetical protein